MLRINSKKNVKDNIMDDDFHLFIFTLAVSNPHSYMG